jgi:hypothetical protein
MWNTRIVARLVIRVTATCGTGGKSARIFRGCRGGSGFQSKRWRTAIRTRVVSRFVNVVGSFRRLDIDAGAKVGIVGLVLFAIQPALPQKKEVAYEALRRTRHERDPNSRPGHNLASVIRHGLLDTLSRDRVENESTLHKGMQCQRDKPPWISWFINRGSNSLFNDLLNDKWVVLKYDRLQLPSGNDQWKTF